jgi:23S rRNA maturation mini-RNase III
MPTRQPRYSAEETARRGDAIYERDIRSHVEKTHRGKVVAIDVDSSAYVVADNAFAASERLLAQHPDAEIWCVRIGHQALHRLGGRPRQGTA